jgi:dTDP-L-rhamnose 4-epimerase
VLVTGGAGFIGSHTVDLLLQRGYEVRVLDALCPPVHVTGVKPSYLPVEVEFIHGDVRDPAAMDRGLAGVEAVFHLAAYQDYLPDFSTFAFTNDGGTAMLYERIVAGRLPVRKVVVASSQATYGEGKYCCAEHGVQYPDLRPEARLQRGDWEARCAAKLPDGGQCGEPMAPQWTDETRVNPANQYAVSKYCQELYALTLGRRYGIPTVVMRYSIVQGPRQSFRNAYSGVLRIFTVRLLNNQPPVVYEDGQQLRDYVYVTDVARANLLVLEDSRADYGVFNVGGGRAYTVLEYAGLIADLLGKTIEPCVPGKYRFGDTRHILSDIDRLRALGWEPTVPLRDIAASYIAWAEVQPDLRDYSVEADRTMAAQGTVRSVGG